MLTQLIYASRASFVPHSSEAGIEPTVARILQASRRHNPKRHIGGVLYYRDSAFFQTLEGPQEQVEALVEKLRQDPRHEELTVLSRRQITRRQFAQWSMKYTNLDHSVNRWLVKQGIASFDPLIFDAEKAQEFSEVLRRSESAEQASGQSTKTPESKRSVWRIALVLAVTVAVLLAGFFYVF